MTDSPNLEDLRRLRKSIEGSNVTRLIDWVIAELENRKNPPMRTIEEMCSSIEAMCPNAAIELWTAPQGACGVIVRPLPQGMTIESEGGALDVAQVRNRFDALHVTRFAGRDLGSALELALAKITEASARMAVSA